MSNGEQCDMGVGRPAKAAQWKLLDSIQTSTAGQWVDIADYRLHGCIQVGGINTSTAFCELRGSNHPTLPIVSDEGEIFGLTITASGIYSVDSPPRFIKVAWTGDVNGGTGTDTASVYYVGSR